MATVTKRTTKKKENAAGVSEAVVYDMKGKQVSTIALPPEVFNVKWNADLVHQVLIGIAANARPTVAHTKTRGEVRGGGKKPWKQKGTGRARHGSTRSPIWKGGGVTHGPRAERNYSVKVNRRMRANALFSVLSQKLRDGEVIFVDKLSFALPKTADAKHALSALAKAASTDTLVTKRANAALISLSRKDAAVEKSFRNLGNVALDETRNLNAADVLSRRYLIIESPAESLAVLSAKRTA